MNLNHLISWLLGILIVITSVLGLWAVLEMRKDGSECIANPIVYGVKDYSERYGDYQCTCSFLNGKFSPEIITKDGTRPLIISQADNIDRNEINFSGIQVLR